MSTKKILIICTILSILSGCKNNEPVTKATDELKGYPIKMFAEWKWEGELTENMEIILKDIKDMGNKRRKPTSYFLFCRDK
jgi:hypothetical protein